MGTQAYRCDSSRSKPSHFRLPRNQPGAPERIFLSRVSWGELLLLTAVFRYAFCLLASAFMATTPLFVVYATFAQTVVVEALFCLISFWLFYSATRSPRPGWLMFASGVAAGLGFLTRETTGALLLFYGVLFFVGFGMRRRYYWIMALGFLLTGNRDGIF